MDKFSLNKNSFYLYVLFFLGIKTELTRGKQIATY